MSTNTSFAPAFACSICMENLQSDGVIVFTSCRHIFHRVCLELWRNRSPECPRCRNEYHYMQNLLLSFDDTGDNLMKALEAKIINKEIDFIDLQAQYTNVKEELDELNAKILIYRPKEEDFLALQNQYAELERLYKEIEEENKCLSLQVEAQVNEISSLKKVLEEKEIPGGRGLVVLLENKVMILERKLDHMSKELKKEISNSTQLSIDNMKLQSLTDQCGAAKMEPSGGETTDNSVDKQMQNLEQKQKVNQKQNTLEISKKKSGRGNLNSVVIKRFPYSCVLKRLKDTILILASEMKFTLYADNISNVRIFERRIFGPNMKVTLLVEFKTEDIKIGFLESESKLKNHLLYCSLQICEYIDPETNSLLEYAKAKLKGHGFSNICYYKGQVKASKNGKEITQIYSKVQVDELLYLKTEEKEIRLGSDLFGSTNMLRHSKINDKKEGKGESPNKRETDPCSRFDGNFYALYKAFVVFLIMRL
uniref:RING-type domain-containing protein n=1 Tax=Glossina brevipalpis TaxID=37001 RepID=A0A1A9WEF7_9MUSC